MDHYFLTLIYGGGPLCTIQRLKATCDEPLSTFAFKCNLRRYIKAVNGEVLKASGRSVNIVVEAVRSGGAAPVHFDIERAGQGMALDVRQGLTLFHVTAQPELILTKNTAWTPQLYPLPLPSYHSPEHPLNNPQMQPLSHTKRLRWAEKWTSVSP